MTVGQASTVDETTLIPAKAALPVALAAHSAVIVAELRGVEYRHFAAFDLDEASLDQVMQDSWRSRSLPMR